MAPTTRQRIILGSLIASLALNAGLVASLAWSGVGSPIDANGQVRAVNEPLRAPVGEFPNARFFDLGDLLRDDKGDRRPEYSTDGLHLNIKGYLAVADRVGSLIGDR